LIGENGEEQIQDVQSPGYKNATNNQMELKACILALNEAIRLQLTAGVSKIIIYSDSQYLVDNYKKAMFDWPKTTWHRRSGSPVLNADLWKELIRTMKKARMRVEFKWVKGHSKNAHNKAADRMARQSAIIALNSPLSLVHVRRKYSSESLNIGSVEMLGQRMSIRIITAEYLNVQKVWKCKHEVISKRSKYYGNVDIIFSDSLLKAGHSYYVRVNEDTRNARIVKVFGEILKK